MSQIVKKIVLSKVAALGVIFSLDATAGDILFGKKRLELYSTIPVTSFWAMNPPEPLKQAVTLEGQYVGPVELADDDTVGTTIMQDGHMGLIQTEADGLPHLYVKGPTIKLLEIHHKDPTFLAQNVEIIHKMHPASFVMLANPEEATPGEVTAIAPEPAESMPEAAPDVAPDVTADPMLEPTATDMMMGMGDEAAQEAETPSLMGDMTADAMGQNTGDGDDDAGIPSDMGGDQD